MFLGTPRPALPRLVLGAMPAHSAEGYYTVPFVMVGGPDDLDLRTSLAALIFFNDRTAWEALLAAFAPSEMAI